MKLTKLEIKQLQDVMKNAGKGQYVKGQKLVFQFGLRYNLTEMSVDDLIEELMDEANERFDDYTTYNDGAIWYDYDDIDEIVSVADVLMNYYWY